MIENYSFLYKKINDITKSRDKPTIKNSNGDAHKVPLQTTTNIFPSRNLFANQPNIAINVALINILYSFILVFRHSFIYNKTAF